MRSYIYLIPLHPRQEHSAAALQYPITIVGQWSRKQCATERQLAHVVLTNRLGVLDSATERLLSPVPRRNGAVTTGFGNLSNVGLAVCQ
jgi:hypothetical protein